MAETMTDHTKSAGEVEAREAFEGWMASSNYPETAEIALEKLPDGNYRSQLTFAAWQGWQGGARHVLTATKAEPSRIAEIRGRKSATSVYGQHQLDTWTNSDFAMHGNATRATLRDYLLLKQEKADLLSHITAIEADLNDYKHWADDVRHLTRLLDIELNGDNAAKQASLCDLIGSIKPLKDDKDRLTKALEEIEHRADKWLATHESLEDTLLPAIWEDIREEIDQHRLFAERALSPPSTSQSEWNAVPSANILFPNGRPVMWSIIAELSGGPILVASGLDEVVAKFVVNEHHLRLAGSKP